MEAECTCEVALETSGGRVAYPAPLSCLRLCTALELSNAILEGSDLSESALECVACRTIVKTELTV